MKKILFFCMAAALCALHGAPSSSLEELRGLNLSYIKVPIYNHQKMQLMIFAVSAERQGSFLIGKDTLIDVIRSNANVDAIADGWKLKMYPLHCKLPEVLEFWRHRIAVSDAVLYSPLCAIDQQQRRASGVTPVYLRSPALDMDGIGFSADFNTRIVKVTSNVRIVVRFGELEVEKLLASGGKIPEKHESVTATADSLLIDMTHNEIMLIGNVHVQEGNNRLTSDRLTIFLAGDQAKNVSQIPGRDSSALKGVSRILADGDVVIIRQDEKDHELQRAEADHLEYEVATGRITFTGDENMPRIRQGAKDLISGKTITLFRNEQRAVIRGNCRIETAAGQDGSVRKVESDSASFESAQNLIIFRDHVIVTDPSMQMRTKEMRIFLKENHSAGTPQKQLSAKELTSMTEFTPASGKRELDHIFCSGGVTITGSSPKTEAKKDAAPSSPSTLHAERAEFYYAKNYLDFFQDVQVSNEGHRLSCDTMRIYLADRQGETGKGAAPIAAGLPAQGKTLRRITAQGGVVMISDDTDVITGRLTLLFQDAAPGSPGGMFQSGGVRLTRINCDENFCAVKHAPPQSGKSAGDGMQKVLGNGSAGDRFLSAAYAQSDLLKNVTEFHENVHIFDDMRELHCRDMYIVSESVTPAGKEEILPTDPDADPFDLGISEDAAPQKIALTDNAELKSVRCRGDVLLVHRSPEGAVRQAGGDTALYLVKERKLMISADAPKRPWIRGDGRKQYSDLITGDLATESLQSSGRITVVEDK